MKFPRLNRTQFSTGFGLLLAVLLWTTPTDAQLYATYEFDGVAPSGIAFDPTDDSYWVTALLDAEIHHYDSDFVLIEVFASPLDGDELSGITYNPLNDSLIVVDPTNHEMIEVDKAIEPLFSPVALDVEDIVNPIGGPVLLGIAYYENGDDGDGSVFIVESVGAQIYEFNMDGEQLRSFDHPDDPDGFPGSGASAPAGGIELALDDEGDLIGFDIIGELDDSPAIHRLDADGVYTGLSISLSTTTATDVAGIVRSPWIDPVSGDVFDSFWCTSTNEGEIVVVDGELPGIAQILDFECTDVDDTITLSWSADDDWEFISIIRNGELLTELSGDSDSYDDIIEIPDVYYYEVYAEGNTLRTVSVECAGVIGAGQVQEHVMLDSELRWCFDITEDGDENLWITEDGNVISIYDKDLELVSTLAGPFTEESDALTGIAYREATETFFVLNAASLTLWEIDSDGDTVGDEIDIDIDFDIDDPPLLASLAYNPLGDGGDGSLYCVDMDHSHIYEFDLEGAVLNDYDHPDEVDTPTPDPSPVDNYTLGVSGVPEIAGFAEIDVAGGTIFDREATRFIRIDSETGEPTGFEMPTEGIDNVGSSRWLGIHNSTYSGEPVAFVVGLYPYINRLYRVERSVPEITPVSYLKCAQEDLTDEVAIRFLNHGPYDEIRLERDGELLATLDGEATEYIDDEVEPGLYTYQVTAVDGTLESAPRRCEVRVGPGAVLRRSILYPTPSPYQLTYDPSDDTFLIATNSQRAPYEIHRLDADMEYIGSIPAPADPPRIIAALAVRDVPSGPEIWTITWLAPPPPGEPQSFELFVQDADGEIIEGPTVLEVSGPDPDVAVTYPSAMAWDPENDVFWFLERNKATIWQLTTDGELIEAFEHPDPPLQDFVFNIGMDFDPDLNTLTATTAGAFEKKVTKTVGITPDGVLTGEVIPLDAPDLSTRYGIVRKENKMYVIGNWAGLSTMYELKASDDIDPPSAFTCEETLSNEVLLAWENATTYDELVVRRDGVLIATLTEGETEYTDDETGTGAHAYTVAGRIANGESSPNACSLVVAGNNPVFLRGDVNDSGAVQLIDALLGLSYMFNNGEQPRCVDALDANDSGALNLLDPLIILEYLFTNGIDPAPPFPDEGADPTADDLPCDP